MMSEPFLVSDDQLRELAATRQGRVSIAGYNYQAAYAAARLVSMAVRQRVCNLDDWPRLLRYDWGEDLDEVFDDDTVRFTQCKRIATIARPAALADVLTGFAPKLLWIHEADRDRSRFRLVGSDPRLAKSGEWPGTLKADVRGHFLDRLNAPAAAKSDRAVWSAAAESFGHEELFDALWDRFDCVYLPADVVDSEPAGPLLAAERDALHVLLAHGRIDASNQTQVLARLRRLVHDNLITFESENESPPPPFDRSPRRLDRADVHAALEPFLPRTQRQAPFRLIDRTFLSEERERERQQFVARSPDWCDVAHGPDETIKFIERDQTEALESAVLEKLVARIGRSGKLPALFILGAPGDGKTTIARRVAARLVDAGEVLIADAGTGLQDPPGEPDEYVQAVERLQSYGRPVVLLLDDPLYGESEWLGVLRKLNRPGLQVGVLAACPQFLFDEHKSRLRSCEVETFEIARASNHERESMAALYGRSPSASAAEDFLVVAMEMAEGVPFSEIIDRLWSTLADGRYLANAKSLSDLPWQARAYLFVCFFSRAYEACPEPLLMKLLEMTGGVPGTSDVRTELQRMKHFSGWRIFRIGKRSKANWDYCGVPITAAHSLIARQAWEQRPLPWCAVGDVMIEASVSVPESIRDVSSLAVRLLDPSYATSEPVQDDSAFASALANRWRLASHVETRYVCDLVSTFDSMDRGMFALQLREKLMVLAKPDTQGWLAALQLWYIQNQVKNEQGFPSEIDLLPIIEVADFSVAPNRATQFGSRIKNNKALIDTFVARLLDALDEKLTWQLDTYLLTYLMSIATPGQLIHRISALQVFMERHPSNPNVRTRYLSFLLQLPTGTPELTKLRTEAVHETVAWLTIHTEDTNVRAQYLSFLTQLPAGTPELDKLQAEAVRETAAWLKVHTEDSSVRTQYLKFLGQLAAELPFTRSAADGALSIDEWEQAAATALIGVSDLVIRSGFLRRHRTLITSSFGLHWALLKTFRLNPTEMVRETLQLSHGVATEWCMQNPSSGLHCDLHLP